MKSLSVTIQMKTIEQYFPVVLFIMLHEMILTFESVDEMLKCDCVIAAVHISHKGVNPSRAERGKGVEKRGGGIERGERVERGRG